MSEPVIVQVGTSGVHEGSDNPNLPLTAADQVASALACWRAGASVIHLHARDESGAPSQKLEHFAPIVEGIRAAGCDAVLNPTTSSAGGRSRGADRWECLQLQPELASFDCGSLNFNERVFENSPTMLRELATAMRDRQVKPEVECYESGHVLAAARLQDEGLLPTPMHVQFVLGVKGGSPATVAQASHMRSLLPDGCTWSICAFGEASLRMNAYCLIEGGHVRTGLEENLHFAPGEHASNPQLVERLVELAGLLQRPIATPAQTRAILGLDAVGAEPRA